METHHYILATAGHVDHGKSALVRALTGIDPDRLPEEKERGITIDLGFAHLELPGPSPDAPGWALGIVDVPGHEDFVKNMVAGVGSVDLALLVVAADDGWMPQTEEHLQILGYLGVTRGVVALTKADLAEGREEALVAELRERLAGGPLAGAPIVPTSATAGRGLEELKAALRTVLVDTPPPADYGKPRLAADRVFSLKGIGTVVTGTLTGGRLTRGQGVVLQPSGQTTRVRGLQSHNADLEEALPGMRTAVNLPDVEPRSVTAPKGITRGCVVTLPTLGRPHDTLDVWIEKSPRLAGQEGAAAKPLKDGALVRIHHGSSHAPGRIRLRDTAELKPGQSALAELRLGQPVFLFAGDRLVIRDSSEQATLAGALVLDPDADRRLWRTEEQGAFLAARAARPDDPAVFVATELERSGVARARELLVKSRFSEAALSEAVTRLEADGRVIRRGSLLFHAPWWEALCRGAREAIDFEHHAHPERPGLGLAQLRGLLKPYLELQGVFEALMAELEQSGFHRTGSAIGRAGHRQALPPHLQSAGNRIRGILAARPLDPPSRKELAGDRTSFEALRFLIQTGEAVPVGKDLVLSLSAYRRSVRAVQRVLREQGRATVSEFRRALGCTRRLMVPLLEKLDAEGITRREGDVRVPGRAAADSGPPR
jgi:selenocysteine-specific elongation factor